jgi:hypothetical protein
MNNALGNNNSIQFFIIYVPSQQLQGQLQTQHSVGTRIIITPWPSDRRLSAKLVPSFADRGCNVASATDPHGRNLGFLDRSRYFSFK